MQPNARKHLLWMLIRTGVVLIAIVAVSVSFAWFRAAGAQKVGVEPLTISAAEAEVVEVEGGTSYSLRGDYNGQTGLTDDGSEMPFFVGKDVPLTRKMTDSTYNPATYKLTKLTITAVLSLDQVLATFGEKELLNSASLEPGKWDDDYGEYFKGPRDYCFDSFCWRIALLKEPHPVGETGAAISNPTYVAPKDWSWSTSNSSTLTKLYGKDVVLEFGIRLYFLDAESLDQTGDDLYLRNAFRYSGYSGGLHDYVDYTYCGATFSFAYSIGCNYKFSKTKIIQPPEPSTGGSSTGGGS